MWPQVCARLTMDEELEKSCNRFKCLNGVCCCWQPRNTKSFHFNSAFLLQPVSPWGLDLHAWRRKGRESRAILTFLSLFYCLCQTVKASRESVCRDDGYKFSSKAHTQSSKHGLFKVKSCATWFQRHINRCLPMTSSLKTKKQKKKLHLHKTKQTKQDARQRATTVSS